jgi:hypothetical protein
MVERNKLIIHFVEEIRRKCILMGCLRCFSNSIKIIIQLIGDHTRALYGSCIVISNNSRVVAFN